MSKKLSRPMKFIGLIVLLGVLLTITITVLAATVNVSTANISTANVSNESEQPLDISSDDLSCRFGATPLKSDQASKLQELGAGWYLNFSVNPYGPAPVNSEFVPMIRLKQLKDGDNYLNGYTVNPPLTDTELGKKIDENQGATWIVGNEPDRGPTDFSSPQDDMMPEMYARAFHDVYEYIKARDPSALSRHCGFGRNNTGRIQYLDKMAGAYYKNYGTNIPADVWTMHLYIMPEVTYKYEENSIAAVAVGTDRFLGMQQPDPNKSYSSQCGDVNNDVYCFADHDNTAFFKRQIRDLRIWMKEHGQQYKPLIITEYSILYPYEEDAGSCFLQDEFGKCFTPNRVSNYLRNTFDLIDGAGEMKDVNFGFPVDDYRLVQQILWFSINTVNNSPWFFQ